MLFAAALLLLQTAPAPAAQTTACKATDASLPTGLLGWVKPGDEFVPGKAVELETIDGAALKGLPAGSKPGRAAMIGFKVESAGVYGVALDQGGWIDVLSGVEGGAALTSVKHGHGPECSTIRKIVRFDLKPGVYRLYVSGLSTPKVKAMLVSGE
ncbi:hypothetical protein P6144_14045 [Sphingomonas sp. HITSZ_GF]|uniref:hypothetical protein n=1 Tax=Sphingomonas sp. HITSZ_GF TaxID=3037247 RepID=UPI00240E7CD9|nr:hypothetical protein [Sphingomonas sp. HITSZ_GF]MDG2534780.1 hypothetical protein [Sphingomonas sp. HITSZ_GF]